MRCSEEEAKREGYTIAKKRIRQKNFASLVV